jgi:hypothetical protein
MALKLVWRVVNSVQRRARSIQNGVVCVEVDQRFTIFAENWKERWPKVLAWG